MAQRVLGELVVKIKGDSASLDKTITQSESKMKNFANNLNSIGNKMSLLVTAPLVALGTALVGSAANMEMLQTSFEVMLSSADKAAKLMADLKEMAASTPFETTDLANASKLLLQYGVSVEDLIPTMRMLGDIASGDQQKFQSLGLVMGQIRALGRLGGQDLRQMVSTGFNPLYVISEKTGESMASLTDKMSKGQISYDQVAQAMKWATEEGGKFYQGMEKGSKTLSGVISTLKDDAMEAGRSMVEFLLPTIKDIVKGLSSFFKAINELDGGTKKLIIVILGIVASIGPMIKVGGAAIKMFETLRKVMGTLATSPILLFLTGLAVAIGVVISEIDKYNKRFEEAARIHGEAANKIKEERNNINNLVGEYEQLRKKTNLTAKEKERMAEIEVILRKELGDTLGVMSDQTIELEKLKEATERYNKASVQNEIIAKRKEILNLGIEQTKRENELATMISDNRGVLINWTDEALKRKREDIEKTKEQIKQAKLELEVIKAKSDVINQPTDVPKPTVDDTKTKELIKLEEEYSQKAFELSHDRLEIIEREKQEEIKKAKEAKASKKTLNDIEIVFEKQKEEAITQIREEEAQKRDELRAEEEERTAWSAEFLIGLQQKIASASINQLGNVFSSLGEALVTGEKGWENFGKAAVGAVAAIIEALSHEFFAKSAGAIADALITAANPFTAWQSPGYWAAAGQYAAAGAGAAIAAGIVRGLAGNIKLGTGGLVMPQAGGVQAILAERGVPEVVIPDQAPIWKMIGDRIASRMSNGTVNNNTYNQIPGNVVLKIGENDFYGALESASRHGKFVIDRTRGLSRS